MQSHIHKVHVCSAVTCHLHFWQNDWGLLHATVVTRGWSGYQNMSQHRKLTLEKKILPPLLQGFEPATFQSQDQCSNHWAMPAPQLWHQQCCGTPLSQLQEKTQKMAWLKASTGLLRLSVRCTGSGKQFWYQIQTWKGSNECLFIWTRTQYAHFWGNPLYQATQQHLNCR